ncbi:MAG TPA: GspH/FimT family pseudopilin [Marinobacter sp.]
MNPSRHASGFTLLELLIVLVFIAIAGSYTLSSWGGWVDTSRHRNLILSYQDHFAYARWEAVTSGKIVTICPLSAASVCNDDWNSEVSVFHDSNRDGKPDGDEVLRVISRPEGFSVTSRTGGKGYLRFSPNGTTHGMTGSLVVCSLHNRKSLMSYLALNKGGRLRIQHDDDHDSLITLPWGTELEC